MIKFRYNNCEYPMVMRSTDDYEEFYTIYPTPDAGYDLVRVTSQGDYEVIENIDPKYVEIITGA